MFEFRNLDHTTRMLMAEEASRDDAAATEYYGRRLTPQGKTDWPDLIRTAMSKGTPESLAEELRGTVRLKTRETYTRNGKEFERAVPSNAAQLLAEGEYNRYYCRALCVRAIAESKKLRVYRARHSDNPRPESEAWIGKFVDPQLLLNDLRTHTGSEPAEGLPSVNSGLSVELV